MRRPLDHEPLDLVLEGANLRLEVAMLVEGDAGADDGATDAARAPKRRLGGYVDVRHVLVFA